MDSKKKYIWRAVKYFIRLMLLFVVLFGIMLATNTTTLSAENFFAEFFGSQRGQIFTAIVLIWCMFYPRVEFVAMPIGIRLTDHKSSINEAMQSLGMALVEDREDAMVFRATNKLSRAWQMWEDAVEVRTSANGGIEVAGSRKNVSNALFKIKLYAEREA